MARTTLTNTWYRHYHHFMMLSILIGCSILMMYRLNKAWFACFLLVLSIPFLGLITGDLKRFLCGFMILAIPMNADINFMRHFSPGGADGIMLGLVDILLLILVLFWFANIAIHKNLAGIKIYPALSVPFFALICWSILSMAAADDPWLSTFDILQMLKAFLLFLFLANTIKHQKDVEFVLNLVFIGVIIQGVIMFFQHQYGSNIGLVGLGEAREVLKFDMATDHVNRPGGTIGHCNHLARYIGLVLPVAMTLALAPGRHHRPYLSQLTVLVGGFALILTLTRTAWLALLISMLVIMILLFVYNLLTYRILFRMFTGLVVMTLMIVIYGNLIYQRLTADDSGSGRTRYTTARVALTIINDHPFLGVGINNYGQVLEQYWDPSDTFTRKAAVHNTYLLYAGEIGIPGLVIYLSLLFQPIRLLKQVLTTGTSFAKWLAAGLFSSYLAMFMMACTDKSYKENTPLLFLYAVTLALVVVIQQPGTKPTAITQK